MAQWLNVVPEDPSLIISMHICWLTTVYITPTPGNLTPLALVGTALKTHVHTHIQIKNKS